MKLSKKYRDFLNTPAKMDFLEGTTYAGKTTIAIRKFMQEVRKSPKKTHIICGLDTGAVEQNILYKELGLLEQFETVTYASGKSKGRSKPHLSYETENGLHTIYVLGYGNQVQWKKILGAQFGCVFIDEINTADIAFVREAAIRSQYLMGTLNPDDPNLTVYKEYINRSRPLTKWKEETPQELLEQLKETKKEGWHHWYFSFRHNPGVTAQRQKEIEESVSPDSHVYKNKILGLRGKATGLIFNVRPEHIITREQAKAFAFRHFSCGVDTSYSLQSEDSFAFVFSGFTVCGKKITLDTCVFTNKGRERPLTPSDIPPILVGFLQKNEQAWGFAKDVFIDSADQGTILECQKFKRDKGLLCQFLSAYKGLRILDRLHLQAGWMAQGKYLILDSCEELLQEMGVYSWKADVYEPEDRNDHVINADQYSWIPYRDKI